MSSGDGLTVDEGIAQAAALFAAGEVRASADRALETAELARASGRVEGLAAAALVVEAVPDPATAATVERLCRDALDALGDTRPSTRARLHGQLSIALHHRDQFAAAAEQLGFADALASATGDPLATVLATHAGALQMAGSDRGDRLLAAGDTILSAGGSLGSMSNAELLGRVWRIDALLRLGRPVEVSHEIDSLDVAAARTKRPLIRWNALVARAGLEQAVGRLPAALATARLAREALPESQRHMVEPLLIAQVMLIATEQGTEPEEFARARALAVGGQLVAIAMTARYDLETGDRTSAEAAFEAIRGRVGEIGPDRRALPTIMALLELAIAFDDRPLATALAERLRAFDGATIVSPLGAVGSIAAVLSRLERAAGDVDRSVAHAEAAVDQTSRAGFGPWLARSRLALAEALAQRGSAVDVDRARHAIRLAIAAAEQMGMIGVGRMARALRDQLEPGVRLSAREREVAGLVASGASNRQIAETLGVSERTIETHVQAILNKLGFRSRTQVAAWVAASGTRQDARP